MANDVQTGQDESPLCSKCKSAKVTGDNKPRWCGPCKTKYHREYAAVKEGRAERRGFTAGVAAMRACMASEFERLGSGRFAAVEVAELILQAPGPKLD